MCKDSTISWWAEAISQDERWLRPPGLLAVAQRLRQILAQLAQPRTRRSLEPRGELAGRVQQIAYPAVYVITGSRGRRPSRMRTEHLPSLPGPVPSLGRAHRGPKRTSVARRPASSTIRIETGDRVVPALARR
ncbi:hypothetical protein PsYK624_148110 [Phanerochaete sordida]|uniref:Uncharacterized protein n=1 Tax=Phanerochaete sordida TaxID=48140 RepID=A0A9P3LKH4_9APHY|nr:hypothetical protein PsYK624_148110 [Phanerochaete sordida]